MAPDIPSIRSFVPDQLLRWMAARDLDSEEPSSDTEEMAVLFADLSDFSRLTHQITEEERAGPEKVTEFLNSAFSTILETIGGYGGEVLGFAGDSVLATWTTADGNEPADAVALAAACGLDIQELALPLTRPGQPALRMRIGIGAGTGVLMRLGGVGGRWHFAIGGSAFDQIGPALGRAERGEVVLSPQARTAIGPLAHGRALDDGGFLLTGVDAVPVGGRASPLELSDTAAASMSSYLPISVLTRLESGQEEWLGEFRRVTSVFVNLPTLDVSNPAERESLQSVVRAAQEVLDTYEGTLARILVDEKGVTVMASFGVPPLAHEHDPDRAVTTSLNLRERLQAMRLDFGIGVATGRAYCGAVGGRQLRQYTTIGTSVNLAARLTHEARFDVYCDEPTARSARRTDFYPLGSRDIRGWDEPIEVFRPLWSTDSTVRETAPRALLGRDTERDQLLTHLDELQRVHVSAVVVIEGAAGIGKSTLGQDLIHSARSRDVRVLTGAALPVAQDPYHAWRDVISEVMGLSGIRAIEKRREIVRQRLAQWPQFDDRYPLLNSVLDLDFDDTEITRGMTGGARRDSTLELLTTLLSEAAAGQPLLIVLDDLHWFDSASWALAAAVMRNVKPVLMVLLTRPVSGDPETVEELGALEVATHIELDPISNQDALALAKETLGAGDLDPEVADVIVNGAEGIPFFVQELAYSLRDADALAQQNGTVRLKKPRDELDVPHSLSSVVLSRIDKLAPEPQLTVKVASVIGRSFDVDELAAVHPSGPSRQTLNEELSTLESLGLITESPSSPGSFDFKHALIRDAAYDLLLYEQRHRIHANVAEYFESEGDDRAERPYGLLAYHWDQAGDSRMALTYLELTGASALRKGADREAIEAHTRSLQLVGEHPALFGDVAATRRSQWHTEIGQAHEALGEFDDALKSLYRALDLTGVHVSTRPWRRILRLPWEIAKQLVHIALPAMIRVPGDEAERERLSQAAHVAALIGEIYYFTGNALGFPVMNLVAINLGEKAGRPLVAGLAYSSQGYLVGTMRMRRLAARYFERARIAEGLELEQGTESRDSELDEMGPGHLIAVALAESVLAMTFNDLTAAREIVTDGLERCDRFGDKYSAGISLAVRGFGSYCAGDLDAALVDYRALLASALERSNREHEGWARSFAIPILLGLDDEAAAQAMSAEATAILDDVDPLTVPIIHGTRSQVELRAGKLEEARASARAALAAFDSTPIFIYLVGYAGVLDTLLTLWAMEMAEGSANAKELAKLARKALRGMGGFAAILPFARPKHLLFKGRMRHLQRRMAAGDRALQKGLRLAQRSGFRWDEGLLHLELARGLPAGDERATHLEAARRLFEQTGAVSDLRRLGAMDA